MSRDSDMFRTDDQFLVERVCQGNRDAFRILVERYQKYAYQIAFRILRNHADAEDTSQEAFVRIYQNIKKFRHEAKFSTYLYRTVVNLSLNVVRAKDRGAHNERFDVSRGQQSVAERVEEPRIELLDVKEHLEKGIRRLSRKQRAILVLRHYEGFSTREVSEILNCSEGTVKQQLHRAMLKLQKFLHYMKD